MGILSHLTDSAAKRCSRPHHGRCLSSLRRGRRPIHVLLVQPLVFVVSGGQPPLDKEVAHVGSDFERIAVGDDHIGHLAHFERAHLIGQTQNLGRIQRYRFQRMN